MKKVIPVLMLSFLLLAACGNADNDSSSGSSSEQKAKESLKPLEVDILTATDAFQPGKKGTIKIKVTKGEETVSDADDVQFEIWQDGHKSDSKKHEAENKKDGIYALSHTFKEKGAYHVITHVTARSSHTMPKKTFDVK